MSVVALRVGIDSAGGGADTVGEGNGSVPSRFSTSATCGAPVPRVTRTVAPSPSVSFTRAPGKAAATVRAASACPAEYSTSAPVRSMTPLRVVTPGWMADSCTKWLTEITVQAEESKGYYMQTAYRVPISPVEPGGPVTAPVEAMVVKSLIAGPSEGETVNTGPVSIHGVAWSNGAKIARVEVSIDKGNKWEPARLVGEDHPYAWRQWQYVWTARNPGTFAILCRATDVQGATQPATSPWNPGGLLWNGWDRVVVTVRG